LKAEAVERLALYLLLLLQMIQLALLLPHGEEQADERQAIDQRVKGLK